MAFCGVWRLSTLALGYSICKKSIMTKRVFTHKFTIESVLSFVPALFTTFILSKSHQAYSYCFILAHYTPVTMAMLLAPYNNSMRLGQGLNLFTQQICMTDAVAQGEDVSSPYSEDQKPKGISQIVSYSSRFVDKLSDVTDVMNVSASLSIKIGTIGGAVSGTYIDSDKFKSSDLNFFIQVKVTNQTHMARDYTQFQKLKNFPTTRFNEIYGVSIRHRSLSGSRSRIGSWFEA